MVPQIKRRSFVDDNSYDEVSRAKDVDRKPRNNRLKTNRSVSFEKSVRVHRSLHLRDYSKEEIAASWLSSTEMSAIKRDAKVAAKKLETLGIRKCSADPNFCVRGLEHRTSMGAKSRMQNKISARKVVMQEQQAQRNEDKSDHKYLAFVYKTESRDSRIMAQEAGMDDEYVAQQLR